MRWLAAMLREEEAVTSVEYAVLLAMIISAAVAGIALVGDRTSAMFDDSRSEIESHLND